MPMGAFYENKIAEKLGRFFGCIFAYLLFTTILFFMLGILGKLPDSWSYPHIMAITFLVALAGYMVKRMLK